MTWAVYAVAHIVPEDDAIAHEHAETCACLPRVEHVEADDEDGGSTAWTRVTHAAWDGRPE